MAKKAQFSIGAFQDLSFISHEEADNPPIQDSEAFASRAREAGVAVTLMRVQEGVASPRTLLE